MSDVNPTELFPEIVNLYDFPSVHASMIFDKTRTDAFKKAIEEAVKPGDVVMDIGAGTGILSLFAAQAGASKVHVVERSKKAMGWAKRVLADSGCNMEVFHFHEHSSWWLQPHIYDIEPVDVIVSEMLGHIGIEEGIVRVMDDARRFLKPGGVMIPREVAVQAYLVHAPGVYRRCIGCWGPRPDGIQGVDFSVMREAAVNNVYVADLGKSSKLSNQEIIFHRVLGDGDCPQEFSDVFEFRSMDDARAMAHGVGVYFDSPLIGMLGLSSAVRFASHWKQCFVPFPEPIEVWPGRILKIRFSIKFSTNDATTGPFSISMEVDDA